MLDFLRWLRPLSPKDIHSEILEVLDSRPELASISVDAEDPWKLSVCLAGQGASSFALNLHNLAMHLSRTRPRRAVRREAIEHFITSILEMQAPPAISLDQLRPMVRHVDYAMHMSADFKNGNTGADALARPLFADLAVVLMLETENGFRSLNPDSLTEVDLTPQRLWQEADVNFEKMLLDLAVDEPREGFFQFYFPDAPWLAPSLLLRGSLFDEFMAERGIEGLLVGVPTRHTLLAADAADAAAIEKLAKATLSGLQEEHPQSEFIYLKEPGSDAFAPKLKRTENGLEALD
ncbi:MAG: hypothetical protein HUJ27_03935 [Rhodobacteraceae bacterium]|nr:hypothetical protein [Paracoccaceae bacterium]